MGKSVDLTGQIFGSLTVLGVSEDIYIQPSTGYKYKKWDCRCECGKIISVRTSDLTNGKTKSCGCVKNRNTATRSYKHGKCNTRLYKIWAAMKERCLNPNDHKYPSYGGRGICICDEWINDFTQFEKWAYENGFDAKLPSSECTIDRINNDGDYCPENCRWISLTEQCKNKRNNHYVEINGEIKILSDWFKEYDIYSSTVWYRIKHGWSLVDALTIPPRSKKTHNNKEASIDGTGT